MKRQRTALDYSHKYVITDHDVSKALGGQQQEAEEPTAEKKMETVLNGFDPVSDLTDRRLLYEVTGIRLYKDEFNDYDSSGSASSDEEREGGHNQQLLDIDYAIMAQYHDIAISESNQVTSIQH